MPKHPRGIEIRVKDWCPTGNTWTHKTICHSCMTIGLWELVSPQIQSNPYITKLARIHCSIRACVHQILTPKDGLPRSKQNVLLARLKKYARKLLRFSQNNAKLQEIHAVFAETRIKNWYWLTRHTKFTAQYFVSTNDQKTYGNFVAVPANPLVSTSQIGIALGLMEKPAVLAGCALCLRELQAISLDIQTIEDGAWLTLLPAELFANAAQRYTDFLTRVP